MGSVVKQIAAVAISPVNALLGGALQGKGKIKSASRPATSTPGAGDNTPPNRAEASKDAVKKLRGSRNRIRQGRASTILTSGRGITNGSR